MEMCYGCRKLHLILACQRGTIEEVVLLVMPAIEYVPKKILT
jgi:hypothetical protein